MNKKITMFWKKKEKNALPGGNPEAWLAMKIQHSLVFASTWKLKIKCFL